MAYGDSTRIVHLISRIIRFVGLRPRIRLCSSARLQSLSHDDNTRPAFCILQACGMFPGGFHSREFNILYKRDNLVRPSLSNSSQQDGQRIAHLIFTLLLVRSYAQDPEVSPNGHVSMWYPTAQGPDHSLISINVIDTLLMSYQSEWKNLNASMWCLTDNATGTYTGDPLNNPCETSHFCFVLILLFRD